MRLVLTNEYAWLLLLVNGLAIVLYIGATKKNRQRAMKFGNYETLQKVAGKNFLKSSNIVLLTRIGALTLLIIGLSSPALVEEVQAPDTDVVFAIDSSSSMLTDDIEPTRLEASKQMTSEFISQMEGDSEVGVVSFAGDISRDVDMTSDYESASLQVNTVDVGEIAGSALGDAVHTSTSMLLETNRSGTVIVITGSESSAGTPVNESIRFAQTHNTTVHTVGIGDESEVRTEYEIIGGENATRAVYPNINENELRRVAEQTGGEFSTVNNGTELREEIMELEEREVETSVSIYFIYATLILLLLEWVLGSTRYSILP